MSPDPYDGSYDFSQSLNRYSYALNNPLSFRDPSGLQDIVIGAETSLYYI
jgi:RHS repeat-associated protein